MPVYKTRSARALPQPAMCGSPFDFQRGELVLRMMTEAAGALPPELWMDAAKAAIAVADELFPEEEGAANG